MPLFHIVILALVQGITEFLPISSSGHLILTHEILGSQGADADLTMDIAVHVGTLFAVLIYFSRDFIAIAKTHSGQGKRLVLLVLIASIPVIVAGFLLNLWQPAFLRSVPVIAISFIVFGLLLAYADHKGGTDKTLPDLSPRNAFLIGLAQVLALIPGTSRSGITMTAGRFIGLSRPESARFSLFLAILAISGAGILSGLDLLESRNAVLMKDAAIAAVIAFFSSWLAIALMMRWLEKATFTPFVVYRIVFGMLLLALYFSGVIV